MSAQKPVQIELPAPQLYPLCKKGARITINIPEGTTLSGIEGPTTVSSECLADAQHNGEQFVVKTRNFITPIPAKWCSRPTAGISAKEPQPWNPYP